MYPLIILFFLIHLQESPPNFESACNNLEIGIGGIQGVPRSKDTYPYPMAECHENLHYDLIWVPSENHKERLKVSAFDLNNYINLGEKNSFEKFKCFAFEIGKTIPEKPENEFDTFDYVFPNIVKVYIKDINGWKYLLSKKITSVQELGELKLETIKQY